MVRLDRCDMTGSFSGEAKIKTAFRISFGCCSIFKFWLIRKGESNGSSMAPLRGLFRELQL
jgi:hypothetical protein